MSDPSGPVHANREGPALRAALAAVLAVAFLARANFAWDWWWKNPYEVHNIDEPFLPYEAMAMWEGVTPRELGWPATTTRFVLSVCYAVDMVRACPWSDSGGSSPPALMDGVAQWTRARIDDPVPLFAIGRWVSVAIGMIQVGLAYWAARRWLSPLAGVLAALMCAISPIAVSYSQYLLADMTGVLFATWLLGLLGARRSDGGWWPVGAGVLVALAAASKCHLGIWLFPALLAIWIPDEPSQRRSMADRVRSSAWLVLGFVSASLLLVPWLWTNPVLMLKKFLGVVWSKMSPGAEAARAGPLTNLELTFSAMGWLAVAGAVPGLFLIWKMLGRRAVPVAAVILVGVLLIATAGEVYDRYGLLIFPAVVLVAAAGFSGLLTMFHGISRAVLVLGVAGLTVLTGWQLLESQRHVGEVESYGLAHAWFLKHLKAGDRIAVDTLYTRRLPRTREQLEAELVFRASPEAYTRKMRSNGYEGNPAEPMRRAVLNDELYEAHWMRRELSGRRLGEGFHITLFCSGPRFNAILTEEAIADFLMGLNDPCRGYDALLLNRKADLGIEPVREFKKGTGPRLFLYLRPRREPFRPADAP